MKWTTFLMLTLIGASTAGCATMRPGSAPKIDCQNRVIVTPTREEVRHLSRLTKQQIVKVNEALERECGMKLPRVAR